MKLLTFPCLGLLMILVASGCATQPDFVADASSSGKAVLHGKMNEALASYESQAQEAERKAAASFFPQQYLEAASWSYQYAARVARQTGQLQKSISHAEKGLEKAERTKNPRIQLNATLELKWSYESVGRREKSRQIGCSKS